MIVQISTESQANGFIQIIASFFEEVLPISFPMYAPSSAFQFRSLHPIHVQLYFPPVSMKSFFKSIGATGAVRAISSPEAQRPSLLANVPGCCTRVRWVLKEPIAYPLVDCVHVRNCKYQTYSTHTKVTTLTFPISFTVPHGKAFEGFVHVVESI